MTAIRFALREFRGGLRGFAVFIACIALGVMAIAGVGAVSGSLSDGLAREGRVILGGDLSFSLIHREANPDERAFLERRGRVSTAATMRAMARLDENRASLVEAKAVDTAYPLTGEIALEPAMPLADALVLRDGVYGAAADPALLARLDVKPPARITIGNATIEIRAALTNEPDKLAGGIGFGPRLLMSDAALRATGLLQPGSLVRWHYRVALPGTASSEADIKTLMADARTQFTEAGWDIRTRLNASPQLERNVERFTQFLTIVGLTALLVGGVGVGNAVKSHLDRRRDTIATMKALGATGGTVFGIYLTQVLLLAVIGGVIGAVLGALMPYLIKSLFGAVLPLPLQPTLHPGEMALSLLYGLVAALAFALYPLGRIHDISVAALFRDTIAPEKGRRRPSILIATAAAIIALAALAVGLAYDRKIALIYVVVSALVFILLQAIAVGVMALAARLPRARATALRMAIANLHRPGALTPSVVLSLGLGLALLVTVTQIDGNLRRQFEAALPERAPSFYFLDIPSDDTSRFDAFIRERAPAAAFNEVPMLRGRIAAVNGTPAEEIKATPETAWALQGDRGITYADAVPEGSRVVVGEWWKPDYDGPPLVSLEQRIAEGLGLKVGDAITVNVLGRNIDATVGNLRSVDWQNLGINFVLVYSPNAFRGAPHTHLATLTYPKGAESDAAADGRLVAALAEGFPSVTSVRVRDALDAVGAVVKNLVLGIRGASAITLIAAALVLGGALAAGHRQRVYDAVILKTLGATRARLIGAYVIEYALLAFATAVFGVLAGSLSAWMIVTELMHLRFVWLPVPALVATFGAVIVTVLLGLVGTAAALGQKPAPVLRHL